MDQFTFIDSFAFLSASLDSLANNLTKENKLHFLNQIIPKTDHSLLLEKASLPYDYLDSWEKFEDVRLPPIGTFNSSLTGKSISEEVYSRLQQIWVDFDCKNLGDFHDIYLQLDVALLASIFENWLSVLMD